MRRFLIALMMALVALSGCASDDSEPEGETPTETPDDTGTPNESPEPTDETPSDEPEENDQPETPVNAAPAAALSADLSAAEAPAIVEFTLNGTDDDGDALTWTFDADGDGEHDANGTELPATFSFAYDTPGTYAANLTVSDGVDTGSAALEILISEPGAPPIVQEIFYIHDDDGGDGTMDHTPASDREGGHGLANLATPAYVRAYDATEPLQAGHAAGTPVEIRIQAFPLAPHPLVEMTGTLVVDGVPVGSATDTQTAVAVALVTTPCTEWVMTFMLDADIPAGAMLRVEAEASNVHHMASCYPGGTDGPRLVFNP